MPVARSAKASTSRVLVVDASVVRAAGGVNATDPVPARARDALKAILSICHRVCLSAALRDEWKRHRSGFAQRWWRQMYARRKVVDCEPPSCAAIVADIRAFPSVSGSEADAVEKDIHLVAAALDADQVVLSWDTSAATVIRKVCADTRTTTSKIVGQVLWIDPIADSETLNAWLSESGPAQRHWRLGGDPVVNTAVHPSRSRRKR